jgi:type IV secretory pathway VirB10-like protein
MRLTPFLVMTMCIGLTGCVVGGNKPKKPLVPVPVAPKQQLPPFPTPAPPNQPPPAPPPVVTKSPPLPEPEPPVVTPPRNTRPRRAATPTPKPPVTAEPAPENQPLRLGAILTAEQRQQYQSDLKQSLAAARASVARTRGQSLNSAQRETMARIQTFIRQAETMTGSDLATAVQLARRAELLGDDLVRSLR